MTYRKSSKVNAKLKTRACQKRCRLKSEFSEAGQARDTRSRRGYKKTLLLFEKNGAVGFRLEDLIAQTGISKSFLYLHFGDRDGTIAADIESAFSQIIRENVDAAIAILPKLKLRNRFVRRYRRSLMVI